MSNDRRIRGISNIGTQRGPSRFSIEASAAARRAEEQRARSNENSFNFEPPQQQPGSPPLYRPKPQRSWGPLAAAPHPADGGGTRVNYGRRGTDDSDPGARDRSEAISANAFSSGQQTSRRSKDKVVHPADAGRQASIKAYTTAAPSRAPKRRRQAEYDEEESYWHEVDDHQDQIPDEARASTWSLSSAFDTGTHQDQTHETYSTEQPHTHGSSFVPSGSGAQSRSFKDKAQNHKAKRSLQHSSLSYSTHTKEEATRSEQHPPVKQEPAEPMRPQRKHTPAAQMKVTTKLEDVNTPDHRHPSNTPDRHTLAALTSSSYRRSLQRIKSEFDVDDEFGDLSAEALAACENAEQAEQEASTSSGHSFSHVAADVRPGRRGLLRTVSPVDRQPDMTLLKSQQHIGGRLPSHEPSGANDHAPGPETLPPRARATDVEMTTAEEDNSRNVADGPDQLRNRVEMIGHTSEQVQGRKEGKKRRHEVDNGEKCAQPQQARHRDNVSHEKKANISSIDPSHAEHRESAADANPNFYRNDALTNAKQEKVKRKVQTPRAQCESEDETARKRRKSGESTCAEETKVDRRAQARVRQLENAHGDESGSTSNAQPLRKKSKARARHGETDQPAEHRDRDSRGTSHRETRPVSGRVKVWAVPVHPESRADDTSRHESKGKIAGPVKSGGLSDAAPAMMTSIASSPPASSSAPPVASSTGLSAVIRHRAPPLRNGRPTWPVDTSTPSKRPFDMSAVLHNHHSPISGDVVTITSNKQLQRWLESILDHAGRKCTHEQYTGLKILQNISMIRLEDFPNPTTCALIRQVAQTLLGNKSEDKLFPNVVTIELGARAGLAMARLLEQLWQYQTQLATQEAHGKGHGLQAAEYRPMLTHAEKQGVKQAVNAVQRYARHFARLASPVQLVFAVETAHRLVPLFFDAYAKQCPDVKNVTVQRLQHVPLVIVPDIEHHYTLSSNNYPLAHAGRDIVRLDTEEDGNELDELLPYGTDDKNPVIVTELDRQQHRSLIAMHRRTESVAESYFAQLRTSKHAQSVQVRDLNGKLADRMAATPIVITVPRNCAAATSHEERGNGLEEFWSAAAVLTDDLEEVANISIVAEDEAERDA